MVLRTALRKEKTDENVPRPRTLIMATARDSGRATLGSKTRPRRGPGSCTTRRNVAGCSRPKGFVRIADDPLAAATAIAFRPSSCFHSEGAVNDHNVNQNLTLTGWPLQQSGSSVRQS
jgi:hypothetical protein